jgi:hypothetical protein
LAEPLEQTLPAFIQSLDREAIWQARARLLAAPDSTFLQPPEELAQVLATAMGEERARERV